MTPLRSFLRGQHRVKTRYTDLGNQVRQRTWVLPGRPSYRLFSLAESRVVKPRCDVAGNQCLRRQDSLVVDQADQETPLGVIRLRLPGVTPRRHNLTMFIISPNRTKKALS
jgi:hypothetical protein